MPKPSKPVALVSALDWGLGHTTRCIPIIRELLNQGFSVEMAGAPEQAPLLLKTFPNLEFWPLPPSGIRYPAAGWQFGFSMIRQFPSMKRLMEAEENWVRKHCAERRVDLILSDNRYGFHADGIPSVFITHQLELHTPIGIRWKRLHYRFFEKFTECWVPDFPGEPSLAGTLSNPRVLPEMPVHYIGILSALEPVATAEEPDSVLVLLSGPEPQRTLLENLLVRQCRGLARPVLFARGLPAGGEPVAETAPGFRFCDLLAGEALANELARASWVVARSGYSTVMDLARFGKRALLIPTPGQPEQIYLARHLSRRGCVLRARQNGLDLPMALEAGAEFRPAWPAFPAKNLLGDRVRAWKEKLA